jgi:hypothetical protein
MIAFGVAMAEVRRDGTAKHALAEADDKSIAKVHVSTGWPLRLRSTCSYRHARSAVRHRLTVGVASAE